MARNPNTNNRGGPFDGTTIKIVWQAAKPVAGYPNYKTAVLFPPSRPMCP